MYCTGKKLFATCLLSFCGSKIKKEFDSICTGMVQSCGLSVHICTYIQHSKYFFSVCMETAAIENVFVMESNH